MTKPFQETLDSQRATEHLMQGDQPGHMAKLPGLSAAVILPDGTLWLGASGKSSESQAMNSALRFGLASVSKTYIAALVLQLAEEGVLSVEDPVGAWFPAQGRINENITLRQLLNHTSGLYRYQQKAEYLAAIYAQPDRVWTAQEIVEAFQGEPECLPGTCFGESAMDYVLLGLIIEKAMGSSVSHQLRSRFFAPLKLEHTILYPEQRYPADLMAHMWWDVTGSGQPVDVVAGTGELPLSALFSSVWTAGAMHATAADLARFVKELFEGNVLGEAALKEMLAPGPDLGAGARYGYSVIIDRINGQTVYWHPGGLGYASIYFHFPEEGLSIAVLGNLMVDLKPIATALRQAYVGYR